ncbi:MAG: xanthine dehydrogenase family protein molybdopterin-binding subunit [Saprospiraceae bacterium]
MTTIKTTYNRRSFLKVSAAAGGGMALGFSWLASCTPIEKAEKGLEMPEEWFEMNGFLKIGDNGVVTIMSPNPEIGQNVKTSMPMIVAEELDVDWSQVIVEQAPLNTNAFKGQIAGGSQSIRRNWDGLRMAGATAKAMLLEAAAQKLEVPATQLSVSNGVISHTNSDQTLTYGELASLAATLEVPEEVDIKDTKDFNIIGNPTKNVDGKALVTGAPLFGLDVQKEGMLIAMIEHPPAFGMKLKSVDTESVKAMPGIVDAFTINSDPGEERNWSDTNAFPDLIAIVGNSTWEVMKAKKALKAEWEVDTQLESTADHEETLNKILTQRVDKAGRRDGNPEAAFAKATQIIERTYSAPFLAHNTMEPMNFYANVTADKAELEGPIQTPESLRNSVSKLLDMPEENIHVMMTRMGGGFGRRLYGNFGNEAAIISKKANAPVKLVYTREDDMTQGTYRPDYKVTYRAALDENNELLAFEVKGTGTNGGPVFTNRFPAGTVENYQASNINKESNISTGAWRAPRSNFIAGAEQAFLDEVAEAAGKDPIEFRLELFQKAIDKPVGERNDYDAERYAGVLKLVKEKANWGSETPGLYRGVAAYYCHNSYVAQVLDIAMENNQPKVKKVWCAVDCGIVVNPEGAINQVEGGIIDGIGHAMYSGLTFSEGSPEQNNFDKYRLIRHAEAPEAIEVFFVDNGIKPTGLGEPSLPPVSGALANALAKATGKRFYTQPFMNEVEVLG